ncbi:TetR/AcrR family transcriptional regulator [Actinoplanes sp. NPDC048967]|uniref:TetR/AcrR family transcriptional regulator n=1 Tax=Actinoplanes sp. NPDC048967 TaxID=3155269 RepID=UPI0033EE7913
MATKDESADSASKRLERSGASRDRLLSAAMDLFAEQGFRNTTVGDIEARAGLAPRSGALYQYFSSKEEVLRAGILRQVEELGRVLPVMDLLPLADLRSEVIMLGRWSLQDLARREPLDRLLRQEGHLFPELRSELRDAVHDDSFRQIAGWLKRLAEDVGAKDLDHEALALTMVGSLGYYRMLESIYGEKPLGVDDDRVLAVWVDACMAIAERFGLDKRKPARTD